MPARATFAFFRQEQVYTEAHTRSRTLTCTASHSVKQWWWGGDLIPIKHDAALCFLNILVFTVTFWRAHGWLSRICQLTCGERVPIHLLSNSSSLRPPARFVVQHYLLFLTQALQITSPLRGRGGRRVDKCPFEGGIGKRFANAWFAGEPSAGVHQQTLPARPKASGRRKRKPVGCRSLVFTRSSLNSSRCHCHSWRPEQSERRALPQVNASSMKRLWSGATLSSAASVLCFSLPRASVGNTWSESVPHVLRPLSISFAKCAAIR